MTTHSLVKNLHLSEGWGGVIPDSSRSTTPEQSKSQDSQPTQTDVLKPNAVIDITHEALIRHWKQLRDWVEEYRIPLEIERRIEADAKEWTAKEKPEGLLLREGRLVEAEDYQRNYLNLGFLDGVAQEFIEESIKLRDRLQREKDEQLQREQAMNASLKQALTESILREQSVRVLNWLSDKPTEALVLAIQTTGLYLDNISKINQNYKFSETSQENELISDIQNILSKSWEHARIANYFQARSGVTYATFSSDGKIIASSGESLGNPIVELWNLQGQQIAELRGHEDRIICLAFSPTNDLIATSSEDKSIRLWNIKGEQLSQISYESTHPVRSMTFSCNGQTIATGSDDCTVRLWNLQSAVMTQLWVCETKYPVKSLAFNPNGKIFVSGGSEIKVWDTEGNSLNVPLEELKGDMQLVSFGQKNDHQMFQILTICDRKAWLYDSLYVWLLNFAHYDISDNTPINCRILLGLGDYLYCATLAPHKKVIVAGNGNGYIIECDFDGYLIRQYYQEPYYKKHKSKQWVGSVAFSPDGQILLSSGFDGNIYLWDWSEQPSSGLLLETGNDKFSTENNSHELATDTAPTISLLDYLKGCCDRLRYHPVFKNPQTEVEKQACETCQKYVWGREESKE